MSETPTEQPDCEHYWAYRCYGGLSARTCQLCHEPDWDAIRLDHKAVRSAERARIRDLAAAFKVPVTYDNAYPVEAVPWAAFLDILAMRMLEDPT